MRQTPAEPWADDLELLRAAAREAGRAVMGFFRNDPHVSWKNGGRSPVTEADFAANRILADRLRPARPDYGWLSEESDDDASRLSHETLFVIDPIDGTRAFIAGEPTWVVSAAVVHRGRPVAGVLYAPVMEEEFTAVAGGPALRNGAAISVNAVRPDGPLRLACGKDMLGLFESGFAARIERAPHVPSLAYRLAMVADGRLDATLVRPDAQDWDLAAAELVLEAAGGALCDCNGEAIAYNRPDVSHGFLCAAAAPLIGPLLRHFSWPREG
ncbi:3'(2'),5'-bisphosphate nucleotidase CysQ [Rhizobiaceae bacterium BDR2-2]|uniref:3'(2'),5'-bisphosphate nucleotidase CysQ n=1 Tax=Ectorhizobium quercum TaxID=2965071 RepID=A0AAE3MW27_9HYPH|nr:3'(2'),5'-bisphosphate nucleotidase CysQ [Ectorhizobium quercum]MCX8996303.1 3'(2'),5'-bisphosphate nucleotidase CysQ [Ectorhizobium quercum]MCX8998658.1 3'(2'),5'-bisphosphate nucleotidase CysQ [Ectorhizobium quercum]